MHKIKTLNGIAQEGMDLLSSQYEVTKAEDVDAIILRSASMHEFVFPQLLKSIARAGVGVNNIPLEVCAHKGIVVFNTPGANANAVKELVLAALLMASRDVVGAIDWTRSLKEEGVHIAERVEKGKSNFTGPEIKGKTLGIIGLGAVGVLIANAASSLGMHVLGFDPYISIENAWGLSRRVVRANSYDQIFAEADYLTLHVPLVDATQGLINAVNLKKMKNGVRVLNFARAELVNDEDMAQALKTRKVSKYVTDFPNASTMNMEHCIQIPHLGASTPESEINCAVMAVQQTMDYLETGTIKNAVNYPDCECGALTSPSRITLNHQNIPNMVGQITSILGTHQMNIAGMQNMSKKDWAYTVLDIEGAVDQEVVEALSKIEGVVKVRVIQNIVQQSA